MFFFPKKICFLVLSVSILFAACSLDDDDDEVSLDGTWVSDFGDGYIINLSTQTLEYDDGFGGGFDGTIKEIITFNSSGTAGVIFIKFVNKPYYLSCPIITREKKPVFRH